MKVEELIDAVKQRVKKYDQEMEMTISAERYQDSLQNREKLKNLLRILESLDKSREVEESCALVNKKEEKDSVLIKKKPVNEKLCYAGLGSYEIDSYVCSNCGCGLRNGTKYRDSFCPNCGTEIDWDSNEEFRSKILSQVHVGDDRSEVVTPTDIVQVVRCKDCRYCDYDDDCCHYVCMRVSHSFAVSENDFCSHSYPKKRKESY